MHIEFIPSPERLSLSAQHMVLMSGNDPSELTLNCKTFFCFVYYGLMDDENYLEFINNTDYEPWKAFNNWAKWDISYQDDALRNEQWAHYRLHRDMALKNPYYQVRRDPVMGLGLYAKDNEVTGEHLYPEGGIHKGLIGFFEWVDVDTYNFYEKKKFPSLYYDDLDNNWGMMYGPLYFCNHQPWGNSIEPLDPISGKSHQILLTTRELARQHKQISESGKTLTLTDIITNTVSLEYLENLNLVMSQEIDSDPKQHYIGNNELGSLETATKQSYYVCKLFIEDYAAKICRTTESNSSNNNSSNENTEFTDQIFICYDSEMKTTNQDNSVKLLKCQSAIKLRAAKPPTPMTNIMGITNDIWLETNEEATPEQKEQNRKKRTVIDITSSPASPINVKEKKPTVVYLNKFGYPCDIITAVNQEVTASMEANATANGVSTTSMEVIAKTTITRALDPGGTIELRASMASSLHEVLLDPSIPIAAAAAPTVPSSNLSLGGSSVSYCLREAILEAALLSSFESQWKKSVSNPVASTVIDTSPLVVLSSSTSAPKIILASTSTLS
mmetsp:Transcript_114059/g.322563  ORF Transcript_114059/g.322563 Transcript_114059/m.322563 type:complete len:557 (-) Transcript_114059:809-2479(-)